MSLRKHNQALAFWMSKVAEPLILKGFLGWTKLAQTISAISIFPNQENIRWYLYIPSIFRLLCDNALAVFLAKISDGINLPFPNFDFSRKIPSPPIHHVWRSQKKHAKLVFTNDTFRPSSSKYSICFFQSVTMKHHSTFKQKVSGQPRLIQGIELRIAVASFYWSKDWVVFLHCRCQHWNHNRIIRRQQKLITKGSVLRARNISWAMNDW